ncbi:MAG: alpha-galactosidase [Planctomycetes bacterium]|nr:alpha-galactosidase [Planctomycetota bacterium]
MLRHLTIYLVLAVLAFLGSTPDLVADDGSSVWVNELTPEGAAADGGALPFSFTYGGKPSAELLSSWRRQAAEPVVAGGVTRRTATWDDPATGLRVTWQVVRYADYPAAEWLLWFENRGDSDTQIVEKVQAMDVVFRGSLGGPTPFRLYRTKGGPANPADFEPYVVGVDRDHPKSATAGQGRSSHLNLPFFKLDTARGTVVIAVGWSGMWKADFTCPENRQLRVTAGLEKTHFRLHPGEKVRSPRMLVLTWCGDTWEANARFRRLLYDHYAARRSGQAPLPMLFCNTCFTRGGGWLNECNAQNQISLINAYAPLGLAAVLTDAGWFEGGWPAGAGNWTPRKDAYPDGMGPVAAAAKAKGMIYGLWFEPERVVAGTWLHKNRPEWLLRARPGDQQTYLLNFGLAEVRQYFFEIVKGFMDLPGFRFYRQDFNMDPLPYWRFTDPNDRQGITEMKYIEGLYAYWDMIAQAWPDSVREECASGGNRIDLETVMRMHLHQKTDYWFRDEVDQASLWGLSQYLPNNVVVAHLNRLDEYSFHSTLASSLCLGWIADAPDFDVKGGRALLDRYLAVRHLLVGEWYPLLPYSRGMNDWTGSQFHRPDLDEGMLLVFRRPESPYRTADVALRGVRPDHTYEMECFGMDGVRRKVRAMGRDLLSGTVLTLPKQHQSDLIVYRRAAH